MGLVVMAEAAMGLVVTVEVARATVERGETAAVVWAVWVGETEVETAVVVTEAAPKAAREAQEDNLDGRHCC